jgi:hypothetical protein
MHRENCNPTKLAHLQTRSCRFALLEFFDREQPAAILDIDTPSFLDIEVAAQSCNCNAVEAVD